MGKGIKKLLLCLLAVSLMTVSGRVSAADDGAETAGSGAEEQTEEKEQSSRRSETVEKAELSAEDADRYLKKIGSADGYDIYYKDKDFGDRLWEAAGGRPKSKKDYTDEQKALAEKIDELKKLGELVAIDRKTGRAAASFGSGSRCDEGMLYVSEAGRFFVITDESVSRVKRLRKIISALDSRYAFISADGKTVELLRRDMKAPDGIFSYDRTEDGKRVYSSDSGSFAWLSQDGSRFYGAYRYGAENEYFRMIIDDRTAIFGIESKKSGYIWWSSPIDSTRDPIATDIISDELRSSNVLRYGVPLSRSNNNFLRSGSERDCTFTVSDIKNGIRVVYDYQGGGFRFPAEYTLEGDSLRASVKVSEITESKSANIATEMTVLGSFGAAGTDEEGYFVVPDGSGALIRFNNRKSFQKDIYQQRVYGSDITAVPQNRGAVTEQIYLPVYGIVKEDNALLAVAESGASNACLTANVSQQSNSSYNLCGFTFTLRGTDSFYMSGSSSDKYTVFEKGAIKSDDIVLRYFPIDSAGADYTDIAARYRQYLIDEQGVEPRCRAGEGPLYLDLYGGTMKKRSLLGIPVSVRTALTDYGQAADIIERLSDGGVEDMNISYHNWTGDGMKKKVDTDASPSGKLGGRKGFERLKNLTEEKGFGFYPASDNRNFRSGNGYYSFTDTAVRISGSYARIVSYDRAYGIPDGFRKNLSLLSPSYYGKVFGDIAANYSRAGLEGVSLDGLTAALYGDYGKKSISRGRAQELLEEGYESINGSLPDGILADGANAYALPYVSCIRGVPVSSGRFDLFDEDIPFYQLVLHGVIPYSTEAVNGSADPERMILMAAVTGSSLCFDMIYEEPGVLKDTEYDVLYYADHRYWTDTAARAYRLLEPILADTSDSFIKSYEMDGELITTTFENGAVVSADLEKGTVSYKGSTADVKQLMKEGAG